LGESADFAARATAGPRFPGIGQEIGSPGLRLLSLRLGRQPSAGSPHYFRIHGPAALVEYDNTQNGANHVHPVWIDPQGVFGRDS